MGAVLGNDPQCKVLPCCTIAAAMVLPTVAAAAENIRLFQGTHRCFARCYARPPVCLASDGFPNATAFSCLFM